MPRQRYTTEQIINKLRQVEVLIAQGRSIREVAKELAISDHTFYRRRREYGGIRTEQAKRLKILEKENERLNKLVADLSLDNAIFPNNHTQNNPYVYTNRSFSMLVSPWFSECLPAEHRIQRQIRKKVLHLLDG